MSYIFYSAGKLYPLEHSLGTPEVVFAGSHTPIVPTSYRRASKLRVRLTVGNARKDYALLDGFIFDFTRIILPPVEDVNGNLVLRRFNGETVGVIPLFGGDFNA